MSISSGALLLKKADGTAVDKKIEIDGGVFTQTGGTVSTKDMELKNGGTYNQSDGELQISHDLKVKEGTTFNEQVELYISQVRLVADLTLEVMFNFIMY